MPKISKNIFAGGLALFMLGSVSPSVAQAPAAAIGPRLHSFNIIFKFPPKAERKPIPFELLKGVLVFRAKINGQPVWAVLDNGADMSSIDRQFAVDQKIAVGPIVSPFKTASGTVERRIALNVPFELPGQFSTAAPFSVVDLRFMAIGIGRPISLVVGREYFANFLFAILTGRRTFEIGPGGRVRFPASVPLAAIEDDRARVQVDINGTKLSLLVDLGATGQLLVGPAAWTRLGLEKAPHTSGWSSNLNGKLFEVLTTTVPRATFGPFAQDNVRITRQPKVLHDADGYIGLGFLSNFNFAIDVKGRKLWMLGVKKAAPATSPTL